MARFPIRPARGMGINAHPSLNAPEHASSTYIRGAILQGDGSGLVQEAGADPVGILGIAEEPAKNKASGGVTRMTPTLVSVMFEISMDKTSTLGTYALLATDRFKVYGVTRDSSGIWFLDTDKTLGDGRFRILEFKDPVGTNQPRVFGVFLLSQTDYN